MKYQHTIRTLFFISVGILTGLMGITVFVALAEVDINSSIAVIINDFLRGPFFVALASFAIGTSHTMLLKIAVFSSWIATLSFKTALSPKWFQELFRLHTWQVGTDYYQDMLGEIRQAWLISAAGNRNNLLRIIKFVFNPPKILVAIFQSIQAMWRFNVKFIFNAIIRTYLNQENKNQKIIRAILNFLQGLISGLGALVVTLVIIPLQTVASIINGFYRCIAIMLSFLFHIGAKSNAGTINKSNSNSQGASPVIHPSPISPIGPNPGSLSSNSTSEQGSIKHIKDKLDAAAEFS